MVDATRMLRLMAWLSPAFPVGAFSYSHGLERAVEDGLAIDLGDWIETLIRHGSGWNDAVLVAEAWRRAHDGGDLVELCELGEATAGGAERHLESMAQGDAFGRSVAGWLDGFDLPGHCSYPIAFGAVAGVCDLPRETALAAWLQAFASNQIQAGIRLSLIGQDGGLALLRRLEPVVAELAAAAARSSLDDLGGAAFIAEIAAMNHEIQYSRLFRS